MLKYYCFSIYPQSAVLPSILPLFLPLCELQIEDLIAEDDKVALRVTVHGVSKPPGEPLPLIMEMFRIENGRVAEIWGAGTLRRSNA